MAKAKKPRSWSHPATPRAAIAIAELLKVREQQAILAKKSAFLQQIVMQEGGGAACGVRAAVRHQNGGSSWRRITLKERDYVVFLKAA